MGLAGLGDQRESEQPVERHQRAGAEQERQRGHGVGVGERRPRGELDERTGEERAAGCDRRAEDHERVGHQLDDLAQAGLLGGHVSGDDREHRGQEHGGDGHDEIGDPVADRVEPDLAVAAVERDDQGVRPQIDLVDGERQAEHGAGDQQLPPNPPLEAGAHAGQPSRQATADRQRRRRAERGGGHRAVEPEPQRRHRAHGAERQHTPQDLGDHRIAHQQPSLEDGG